MAHRDNLLTVGVGGGRKMELGPIGWGILDMIRGVSIDHGQDFAEVVHGDAEGADKSAGRWAKARGLKVRPHAAQWKVSAAQLSLVGAPTQKVDRSGGIRRTAEILKEGVDVFVLFPGGDGTDRTRELLDKLKSPPTIVDNRTVTSCKAMRYTDVRGLAEVGYDVGAYVRLRQRCPGLGLTVAHRSAFHDDNLPDYAVDIGEGRLLAMPCSFGDEVNPRSTLAYIRSRWRDRAFRGAVESLNLAKILVCSCGRRYCQAPVLATIALSLRCRRLMLDGGDAAPDPAETKSSTLQWSTRAVAAFADCA